MLEVSAGEHPRHLTPVEWSASSGFDAKTDWRLLRQDDSVEIPVQVSGGDPATVTWILKKPLAKGGVRRFVLEAAKPKRSAGVEGIDQDGKHILFRHRGKKIARYNQGVVQPPSGKGIGPEFARSGYVHPVWSPKGRLVTNDFPLNHKHHHGIWFPWTATVFEGRKVDFWNSGKKEGRVECTGVDPVSSGPVFATLKARHRFLDLTAPDGPKPVLKESWTLRVYALTDHFLYDFTSVQECAGSSPLVLKQSRYGGFGFRGSGQWEGETGCEYLTSEGRTRADGHATAARWCDIYGKVDDHTVGAGFLCHPTNFRSPQRMRIHPNEPFFNWAPCQNGDFAIEPGKKYVSRYRIHVYDGAAQAATSERLWNDYAHPPKVEEVVVGRKE